MSIMEAFRNFDRRLHDWSCNHDKTDLARRVCEAWVEVYQAFGGNPASPYIHDGKLPNGFECMQLIIGARAVERTYTPLPLLARDPDKPGHVILTPEYEAAAAQDWFTIDVLWRTAARACEASVGA